MANDNVLPEERSVSHVMVHKLPPLHHIVGVQLTGGVHIRDNVDADLILISRIMGLSFKYESCMNLTRRADGRSSPDFAILGLNTPSLY